jgi:hypothetical protein
LKAPLRNHEYPDLQLHVFCKCQRANALQCQKIRKLLEVATISPLS